MKGEETEELRHQPPPACSRVPPLKPALQADGVSSGVRTTHSLFTGSH